MTAIGKDDLVECISDAKGIDPRSPLKVGAIYRVTEVGPDGEGNAVLRLQEVAAPLPWCGFAVELFCPVYRPDPTLIASLKAPAHAGQSQ